MRSHRIGALSASLRTLNTGRSRGTNLLFGGRRGYMMGNLGQGVSSPLLPGSREELDAILNKLTSTEEQAADEIGAAIEEGHSTEILEQRFTAMYGPLTELYTSIDEMGEGDIPAWQANAAELQLALNALLGDVINMRRAGARRGMLSNMMIGFGVMGAAVGVGALIYTGWRR